MSETKYFEHKGIAFQVGPRTPCPGIGWGIQQYGPLGEPRGLYRSMGAFYDDDPEHPEGAYAWAESNCRAWIDKATLTWEKFKQDNPDLF